MNKEDKITANSIYSYKGNEYTVTGFGKQKSQRDDWEPCVFYSDSNGDKYSRELWDFESKFVFISSLPVQEQSKQEVMKITFEAGDKIVLLDTGTNEPSTHGCDKGTVIKDNGDTVSWESNTGGTYKTPKERVVFYPHRKVSLPQEQKDKVTGVSDEEIEAEARRIYPNRDIHRHAFKKGVKWRELLSSKAVEQKEPDGWVTENKKFVSRQDYLERPDFYNLKTATPVYFSPPIQEAEHKQGVTDELYKELENSVSNETHTKLLELCFELRERLIEAKSSISRETYEDISHAIDRELDLIKKVERALNNNQ